MFRHAIVATVLLLITVFVSAETTNKPNFSGIWIFNPKKSSLQISPPTSTVFRIKHDEPNFSLSRTHVFNGERNTWGIELTTDGKEVVQKASDHTLEARLHWDGTELVFDSKIIFKDNKEASNIVRYSLSEDGKVFTAKEKFRSPAMKYDNVWVFDRQSK